MDFGNFGSLCGGVISLSFLLWNMGPLLLSASSSCMRVMNHNWSAVKQRLHLHSVAEISHHSVLLGDRVRKYGTLSGSCRKDTDQCL